MNPERWRRINDIFEEAIARGAAERHAFVADVCAGDAALLEQVKRLVIAHEQAEGFLDTPAIAGAGVPSARDLSTLVAQQFGAYQVGTDFRGTARFTVLRRLGAGGMGIVYEAHDRVRDEVIALKTLLRASAADIYRLKREFRSLADIAHPNLVCLYELLVEADTCFFTMELVSGVGLLEYVRPWTADTGATAPTDAGFDANRVRNALRQLAAGVAELHDHGKLHRDIKPSNVMVTADGRVLILDFGLVRDVGSDASGVRDGIAGTPAYLPPEVHFGAAPSEAGDWYAVGVTLYEALTGQLPPQVRFRGLHALGNDIDPPPPADIAPHVPADLNDICVTLLRRDPVQRLAGRDAIEKLVTIGPSQHAAIPRQARRPAGLFVGRARELAILTTAFDRVRDGRPAAVCIHGASGIGKTALVQHFLQRLDDRDDVVVLRGRCYEHESVPFKALDGIIDSLSAYLSTWPASETAAMLPPAISALARAFPVMLQVEAIARCARAPDDDADPSMQRRSAFSSLRELLRRLAERRTLVVSIDDLHWADADSALMLEDLLRPPDAPAVLTLASLRTDELAARPFLGALLDGAAGWITLGLEPMAADESFELVSLWTPAGDGITAAEQIALARDAGGNPFLLEQLAQYMSAHAGSRRPEDVIGDLLEQRLRVLPGGARQFLEVLAVSGRPMVPQLVHEAAGLSGNERPLVAILRVDHLLRSSGADSRIEMYHDRIRETLISRLSPESVRGIHGVLARTLTARGVNDPDALFEHCRGAGDAEAASRYAVLAAKKAHTSLAFDRAASFYRHALDLSPQAPASVEWKLGLAEALTNAGRPREAAEVYLDAAQGVARAQQVDLQRRAAEQFLIGGHIDRGMAVIDSVLRDVNLRLASSPWSAFASLVWRRARLRRRGLDFVRRDAECISPEALLRIDTCWSVTTGLAMVDSIRAADFSTRHLLLALQVGEPYRVARAVALEAGFLASGGTRPNDAADYAATALRLTRECGVPHAEALTAFSAGTAALLVGEWRESGRLFQQALDILRTRSSGATWESNCAELFLLGSLLFRGEIREVSRLLPGRLTAAKDRGNLYFETELRTRMNLVWLAADQPDEGEQHAKEAMERWSHEGFHRQHYNHVLARIQTELYRGRAEAAWRLASGHWTAFERTFLLHTRFLRIEASYLRARCALLMAASGIDEHEFLAIARADARVVGRFGMRWSDAIALLLGGCIAFLEGRSDVAADKVSASIEAFERADMKLYAAVARRRLAALRHDGTRDALLSAADDWMAAQQVKDPARMSRLIAPGLPDVEGSVREAVKRQTGRAPTSTIGDALGL